MSEELRAHKAASEVAAARDELAVAQQQAAGYQSALAEREAEVVAAREAQQRAQQQLAQEQRRAEKVSEPSAVVRRRRSVPAFLSCVLCAFTGLCFCAPACGPDSPGQPRWLCLLT